MAVLRYEIDGLNCGGCAARAQKAMAGVSGVVSAHVNFADHSAIVHADDGLADQIAAASTKAGYPAKAIAQGEVMGPRPDEAPALWRAFWTAAILTLPIFVVEMGSHLFAPVHHFIDNLFDRPVLWGGQFVLATLVLIGPGRVFYRKGVPALLRGAPDMNSLVVLGASAAWAYSTVATFAPQLLPDQAVAVYFEAAAVIVTLILLGRYLEARAKGQTGAAIKRLIGLRPDTARVVRDGAVVAVKVQDVVVGDTIHIAAGERIPVDGIVAEGHGAVDEAMISGEPVPVEKVQGDALIAGTVNGNSSLVMTAQAVGSDTMLARIIEMVGEAQSAQLPVQDLVNRITLWFVPVVMVIAAVTVAVWFVGDGVTSALVAGVSVLIIACPCAMGLATPMSIMVGTGRGAELGVLFRRGDALQVLSGVDVVVFDKTGTLTKGTPKVIEHALTPKMLLDVAAIESLSSHPLATAIVAAAKGDLPEATDVQTLPGFGVVGTVGVTRYVIGNAALMTEKGIAFDMKDSAATRVYVAADGAFVGALTIEDEIKPEAQAAISVLKKQGRRVVLISGDNEAAARAVADVVGIDDVVADVRPDGKVDAVRGLQVKGKVAFVGDGINDAPALAAADVGIAMGDGTDVAVESADVVLVSGNPLGVARAVEVSRRTLRNIWQNLGWAFGYNIVLIPVAALGGLTPQLAALAMAASSVLVVTNALRLRWIGEAA